MTINPNQIGTTLTAAGVNGLVSFKGYLDTAIGDPCRLYFNDSGRSYLEIAVADIKAQVDVPANPSDLRSIVYVDEGAAIVRCQRAFAHDINQDSLDTEPGGATGGHPPWR